MPILQVLFLNIDIKMIYISEIKCYDPGDVYNSSYTLSGLRTGNIANYTCNPGSQQQAGDAVRICEANGTWSGVPIVCGSAHSCSR